MPHRERAYSLSLANGTVWTFTADSGSVLDPWIDEFAHILCLRECIPAEDPGSILDKSFGTAGRAKTADSLSARRNLIRLIPMTDKNQIREGLDESWSSYSQGSAYRAWVSPAANEAILEIEPAFLNHPEIRYIYMSAALRIVFRHCLASGRGCSLHAASAAFNGAGIIITASGQTGKSTCYDRFPATWKPLADDTALAVRNSSGKYSVHPMPTWSDYLRGKKKSTFETDTAYPLKGLFFLEQAKNDEVKPVTAAISAGILHRLSREAWAAFLSRLRKDQKKLLDHSLFDACCSLANATPGYVLRATLRGKFWKEIENVL